LLLLRLVIILPCFEAVLDFSLQSDEVDPLVELVGDGLLPQVVTRVSVVGAERIFQEFFVRPLSQQLRDWVDVIGLELLDEFQGLQVFQLLSLFLVPLGLQPLEQLLPLELLDPQTQRHLLCVVLLGILINVHLEIDSLLELVSHDRQETVPLGLLSLFFALERIRGLLCGGLGTLART